MQKMFDKNSISLFNPAWLIVVVTIPQLVLYFFFYNAYQVVNSLLNKEQNTLWVACLFSITGLLTIFTVYALYLFHKKQKISCLISIAVFFVYLPFLYYFGMNIDTMFPRSIPFYMMSQFHLIFYYPGTFYMPVFIYGILTAVVVLTPPENNSRAVINFLSAVAIPVIWYAFFQLIVPLHRTFSSATSTHFFVIFIISTTILFLFFIIRFFYILLTKKADYIKNKRIFIVGLFTLIFPVASLLIYGNVFGNSFIKFRLFGDFSHPVFLVLAVFNGVFLTIPEFDNYKWRKILFCLRWLTLPFSLYFFVVFLPYFPWSIIAIIFIGLGFLMLTPFFIMVNHAYTLAGDFRYLSNYTSKLKLFAFSITAFLIIPGLVTVHFIQQKNTLNNCLDYVFESDYAVDENISNINLESLRKVIDTISDNKNETKMWDKRIPYVSEYYRWIVLDNLTLSSFKIKKIRNIFFREDISRQPVFSNSFSDNYNLATDLKADTVFDLATGTYKSKIDIEIDNTGPFQEEYLARIVIPEGAFVSGHYLDIENERVAGVLMEKKSVMWIYNRIKEARRDPGIMYYENGNELILKVFPVNPGEKRKTGFELLHKNKTQISLNGKMIMLGFDNEKVAKEVSRAVFKEKIVYFPVNVKQNLDGVKRKPYFHFILDFSAGLEKFREKYIHDINNLLEQTGIEKSDTHITLANFDFKTLKYTEDWIGEMKKFEVRGGLFLDKIIKNILVDHYQEKRNDFPVIVVISNNFENSVFSYDLHDFAYMCPETLNFYEIDSHGKLNAHSLNGDLVVLNKMEELFVQGISTIPEYTVRAWPDSNAPLFYLRDNNRSGVVLTKGRKIPERFSYSNKDENNDKWNTALKLQGQYMEHVMYPGRNGKNFNNLVYTSQKNGVLSPYTCFTVLENKAQWEVLKRKQEQILSAKKSLDTEDDVENMTEPPILLIIVLGCLLIFFKRRRIRMFETC